jgi:hypothetical protein
MRLIVTDERGRSAPKGARDHHRTASGRLTGGTTPPSAALLAGTPRGDHDGHEPGGQTLAGPSGEPDTSDRAPAAPWPSADRHVRQGA